MAIGHHVCPKVAAIGAAEARRCCHSDRRAPRLAGDVAFADQGAQVFGGSFPSGTSIGARLARPRRINSPKGDRSRHRLGAYRH